MGWWPFSSSSSATAPSTAKHVSEPSELSPPTTTTSSANAPKQLTQEQQADADLEAFLNSLEASPSSRAASANSSRLPPASDSQSNDPPASLWARFRQHAPVYPPESSTSSVQVSVPEASNSPGDVLDISPQALRPRSMSCRAAFDSAFYCASLGGKFNDIYRFGTLQPCSEHWEAFWFCMRNRSIHGQDEEKGERIAEYYAAREQRELQRRAAGRSSEDIWELRTTPVEQAFWKVP